MRSSRPRCCVILVLLLAASLALSAEAGGEHEVVEGWFTVVWGDGPRGSEVAPGSRYHVTSDDGVVTHLAFSRDFLQAHGGLTAYQGQRVRVWLAPEEERAGAGSRLRDAAALEVLPERAAGAERDVTGSQPWVSILCKFAGNASEPRTLSFFQNMYDNVTPRLDHYWRAQSYGAANVAGSVAIDWKTLPHTQSYYIPTPGEGYTADLDALFADCTAAADPFVNFNTGGFVGINMMFNDDLDCCAWGGGYWATLDGRSKVWRATWEPPWGYANISVIAHEMGHGFGLPHSNNWDGDTDPYDNSWDVMSDSWHSVTWDATYGWVGQHTIAPHKAALGWITPDQVLTVSGDGVHTVWVDDLALPSTAHYRMVDIPLPSGRSWTVEARGTGTAYDAELPGDAVIVHQVDTGRQEWAWAYDTALPAQRCQRADCESVMFRAGETFADAANAITVSVLSATPTGFLVQIVRDAAGDVVFYDGFECSATTRWTTAQPLILADPGR